MKKLLAKIRNKKLKGNVPLLVIFILLASSVISLLSINQIQRLLTYGNMTFNYFRAFYLAKAGTELGLTEVYNRGNGFEHRIESGSIIVTGNLLSGYEGFEPYFDMSISGNFQHLTNDIRKSDKCENGNKITLGTGEGLMLSLFKDNVTNDKIFTAYSGVTPLSKSKIEDIRFEYIKWYGDPINYFTFGLFDYNDVGDMDNIVIKSGNNLQQFLKDNISSMNGTRKYLTIKNPGTGDEVAEFCITMGGELIPYSDSLITVFGHYGDMEVGLQSIVKKGVPDWTLNVLGRE